MNEAQQSSSSPRSFSGPDTIRAELLMRSIATILALVGAVLAGWTYFRLEATDRRAGPRSVEADAQRAAGPELPAAAPTGMRPPLEARRTVDKVQADSIEGSGLPGREVRLHVVDARTRAELRDVRIVVTRDVRFAGARHPGILDAELHPARRSMSPIRLEPPALEPAGSGERTVFAGARGYAWGAVAVDFRSGGEATIELGLGSRLDVDIVGKIPEAPAVLRLRSPPGGPLPELDVRVASLTNEELEVHQNLEMAAASPDDPSPTEAEIAAGLVRSHERMARFGSRGPMVAEFAFDGGNAARLEGIAMGRLIVSLERGNHWEQPAVFASAAVDVLEGTDAKVTLTIEPPDDVSRRVRLAGSVRYSDKWNGERLDLTFDPSGIVLELADLKPVAGEQGLYRFDLGDVRPGRYAVQSHTHAFQDFVDTGPDGTNAARIVIGDPADVAVHVVDDVTGARVRHERPLLWKCAGFVDGSPSPARWDDEQEAWCFRAPAGEIEIAREHSELDEYEPLAPLTLAIREGRNECELRVRRATGVFLMLEVDGAPADWPDHVAWSVGLVDADGRLPDQSPVDCSEGVVAIRVPAAGRWHVRIPPSPEFEPVEAIGVALERGVMRKTTIALKRSR